MCDCSWQLFTLSDGCGEQIPRWNALMRHLSCQLAHITAVMAPITQALAGDAGTQTSTHRSGRQELEVEKERRDEEEEARG